MGSEHRARADAGAHWCSLTSTDAPGTRTECCENQRNLDDSTGDRRHGSGYAAPDTCASHGCDGSGRGGRPQMRVSASIERGAAATRDEPVPQDVALITGCSTGISRGTAAMLTSAGYHVVATARQPATLDGLEVAMAPAVGRHRRAVDRCRGASGVVN